MFMKTLKIWEKEIQMEKRKKESFRECVKMENCTLIYHGEALAFSVQLRSTVIYHVSNSMPRAVTGLKSL